MKLLALCALLTVVTGDLTPVDLARTNLYKLEDGLWKNVTNPSWKDDGLGGDIEVSKEFVAFDDLIQSLPTPPRSPINSWLWAKAVEKLGIVDGLYKTFTEFIRKQTMVGAVPAPVKEWLDLSETILMDPKVSVAQAVRKLDDLLEHGDLFRAALQEEHPDLCELQLSPHQLIFDMYNTISLTEIKGYAMMQFSWMLLRIYGKGNYTQEASLTRQRYGERSAKTAAAARSALQMARRDLYRCDPPQHKEGETFDQVTRLLQGYIENEVDMNSDGTCRENCPFYTLAENHGCFKDQFCARQPPCRGRILECRFVDSDMWVCPAGINSNRRYEWIEYENGRVLGHQGSCMRGTTKVDSWWRWLVYHCSYCMCLCDEAGPKSDRYFSMRDAVADLRTNKWNLLHCSYCMCLCEDLAAVSERFFSMREAVADMIKNKVVTGIRLIKIGRVFHLQISEGTLGERGSITPSGWVPVQEFDPMDSGVLEEVDYHTLTYERRAIDLDELDSPDNHVLTGARFRMLGSHLHFEIRTTPFNYTTGRLVGEKSQWLSNDNTDGAETPRSQLVLSKPDIPTRSRTPLPVDSQHDQFVEFTNSDLEADAAQSTVPFVDIQPLHPLKGAGLNSGAGIIHRGTNGNGGFIAVKLFTYDYSKHIKADIPTAAIEDVTEPDFVPVVN